VPLTPEHLRRWADELDAEEKAELAAAERKRVQELAERDTLSEEELDWLRRMKADLEAEPEPEEEKPEPEPVSEPEDKPEPEAKKPPKVKSRPGRKSGAAYDWWVDDDGQVYKLDTARIYSGPDEEDEVEIPAKAPAPAESEAA
jgi:hypothetical protein